MGEHARLDGNVARRRFSTTGILWDTELPGFALRYTKSGRKSWLLQYRYCQDIVRVKLGAVGNVTAAKARRDAKRLLAEAALDGLPSQPTPRKNALSFSDFVPLFWAHNARRWKASTAYGNRGYIKNHLVPAFGNIELGSLSRTQVMEWRDSMVRKEGAFNRVIPVLAAMLAYAETMGFRPRGSNPCKGIPRYKRELKERYLSAREYHLLGEVLRSNAIAMPLATSAIWLLIYTGARRGEIAHLRWEWIGRHHVDLPDSKTGPKRLYLNSQALNVLHQMGRADSGPVFGERFGLTLDYAWRRLKTDAGLRDVRLHDLRHSFASVAIGNDVSLTKIGQLLGHVLAETTARYTHLADDLVTEAAQRVGGAMAQALGVSL